MTNIIKDEKDYQKLHEYLERLRKEDLSVSYLNDFFNTFILKNDEGNNLTSILIDTNGLYVPKYNFNGNIIMISYYGLIQYINSILPCFDKDNLYGKIKDLENYAILICLLHELEHSYQGLLLWGVKDTPSKTLLSTYKIVLSLTKRNANIFVKLRNSILEVLYTELRSELALERNANLEAYKAILKLAQMENDKNLINFISECLMTYHLIGYEKNCDGVLVKTAKTLHSLNALEDLKEEADFSFADKVRYGLPIGEEERKEMVLKILNSDDGKYPYLKRKIKCK